MSDEVPSGPAPAPVPLSGLTEIRIHGVGGTPPESLLGTLTPEHVAGDRVAGFYRTGDTRGRHREAYSWGGLTSRSRTRALWLLLLPSMLANMGGWMARRRLTSGPEEESRAPTTVMFRWAARVAALALTVSTLLMVCLLALDVVAYQCGGDAACAGRVPWDPAILGLADRPGRRLVVGAVGVLLVIAVFAYLSYRSRIAYESVPPPIRVTPQATAEVAGQVRSVGMAEAAPSRRCAAALDGGLRHPDFWNGQLWHRHLSRLHLAVCLAGLAAVLAACVREVAAQAGAEPSRTAAGIVAGLACVVIALVVALLGEDEADRRWSTGLYGAGAAVLLGAAVVAWTLPAAPTDPGMLPGMRGIVNVGWILTFALWVPLAGQQIAAWLTRRPGQWWRPATWWRRWTVERKERPATFPWGAPFVLNAVALMLANAVILSVITLVARSLGQITWGFAPGDVPADDGAGPPGTGVTVYLPPAVGATASALTLGLLAAVLLFAGGIGVGALVVRSPGRLAAFTARLRRDYGLPATPEPAPTPEPRSESAWWFSAFRHPPRKATRWRGADGAADRDGASTPPSDRPTAWVSKVALMRYLARTTTRAWILFVGIVVVGMVWMLVVEYTVWILERPFPTVALTLGVTIAVAVPPLLVALLALTFRDASKRRVLGTLFDVGTFFPRSFHPFAPPAYAERAVPELVRRIWRLHDNEGRVVLTAHSQGSVVAAAALVQRSERRDGEPRVGFLSVGSPLAKLYRWAFPALFSDGLLAGLDGDAGIGPVHWRNLYYVTDYIGGPVSGPGSAVPAAVDEVLHDPPTYWYVFGQPLPPVLTHTGYWVDAHLWTRVDAMCDELVAPLPAPAPAPAAEVDGALLSEDPDTVAR
ncbi:putative integral membrane protein [Beutenbergia cavernae DSM 12333]|uniref:Putative integral membrane protein n=1 Tax=Beutenbergia cavernae (strain ATCC BAA-8 / DSM 12333 / CCUG 43141 / JCM 11478 / NBRC 16432 / NCIMB 13614 / HKI 0122) TaxID=471853 RepID=C5BVE4_BEUC1|nr:hypothetical protein [Beutenbergia cavernae]ACQ80531.1 putative integral membrane protein [Beutenbergia cavernae DSM 12333]